MEPPDLGMRVAILRKRAALDRIPIEDEAVLELIAERVPDNVRTLEGALIRVVAHHSLTQLPLDVRLAERVLDEVHPRREPEAVSVGVIKEVVAVHYGVRLAELESATRAARVSWPRQVAIHLTRGLTDTSLQAIGREFGGRNHATVLHACKRVEERVSNDQRAVDEIEEIKRSIVHGRRDRSS